MDFAPTEDTLAEEIAGIVADFHEPPSKDDVLSFVDRCNKTCDWMTSTDRLNFLIGLKSAFAVSYWSKDRMLASLAVQVMDILTDTKGGWRWLDVQEPSSSQRRLLDLAMESFDIPRVGGIADDCENYIYVDDGAFTGRQFMDRAKSLAAQVDRLTPKQRRLRVFLLDHFLDNASEVLGEADRPLREKRFLVDYVWGVAAGFGKGLAHGRQSWLLKPQRQLGRLEVVQRYLDSRPYLRAIAGSDALWRDSVVVQNDVLFQVPEQREVVERVLLEVGCHLLLRTEQPSSSFRPLGLVDGAKAESLGFGSMFCTAHNIPNNAPIALWWHNPARPEAWTPLMRRRIGQ